MAAQPAPPASNASNVSDNELSDTVDADGWQDYKWHVSIWQPVSWVFQDGYFKKQAKGSNIRAVCLQKGQNGCKGAM